MTPMMTARRRPAWLVGVLLLGLLLAGCAGRPPAPDAPREVLYEERLERLEALSGWQAKGRIGLRTPADNVALSLDWTEREDGWRLELRGPLASGSLRLDGRPGRVALRTSEGRQEAAENAAELLARHTGYDVPVDMLRDWMLGQPSPDYDAEMDLDDLGRPEWIRQNGWEVNYSGYRGMDRLDMPMRLDVRGPELRARIIVSDWVLDRD